MKKILVLALALAALTVLLAPAVLAAPASIIGYVYTNNDDFGQNTVSTFSVDNTGHLTLMGTKNTSGSGSGGGYYGHDIIDGCGDALFVANSSSSTIDTFSGRSTGNLALKATTPVDQGTLSMNIECGQKKGGPVIVLAAFSDSGTMNSYTVNPDGSLKKVSGYFIGGVDGADAGVSAKKAYFAATAGSQLFVATIDPNTGALGTPTAANTSGSGDLPAGVADDEMGRGWYIGWANGFGTVVDYCAPMGAPTCKGYTISGGGVNSNTVESTSGTCLWVGNQWSNTLVGVVLNSDGSPKTTGSSTSFGSSLGTGSEFVKPGTKTAVALVWPSGPDNTVTTLKIGTGCTSTVVDTKPTNDFNGWLMALDEYQAGVP